MNIRNLQRRTKHDPNRHTGVPSVDCSCGLVHDDEIVFSGTKFARMKVVEVLGGRCKGSNCRWRNPDGSVGCSDIDLLQIDHVYDDGSFERKKHSSSMGLSPTYYNSILKQVLAGSDRYQLLCANCNWLKRLKTTWSSEFTKWKSTQSTGSRSLNKRVGLTD